MRVIWLLVLLLVGCSGAEDVPVLQLNWKPEPQFGGFYLLDDVEVRAGSADVSPVQLVAAGSVTYGVCAADELLRARANGADVVAIFAVFQTNPQGLMTPASRGLRSLDELMTAGGTVAWQAGLPYVEYLKFKYEPAFDRELPSPFGDLTQYRTQQDYAMQVFVTSEPLAAEATEVPPSTFLIADSGFNPYATVVICRREHLEQNEAEVRAFVADLRSAWTAYLADPAPTNAKLLALNPTMTAETFAASTAAQRPLIEADVIGGMTADRWRTLADQMVDAGVLDDASVADDAFVDY